MVTKPEMEILLCQVDPVPDQPSDDLSAALLTSVLERRDEMTRTGLPNLTPARPIPAPRRRVWVAAIAMAVVVVAIGAVAIFLAGPGDDTAGPAPIPGAETSLEGTWTRTLIEPGFHAWILRATSFGLVAAAQTDGIWISEDGTRWEQVFAGPYEPYRGTTTTLTPPMTAPPPAPDVWSSVYGVAEFDGKLYAFGAVEDRRTARSTSRLVVWSSSDGSSWDETVVEEHSQPVDPFVVSAVVATDDMIIAYEQLGSRILYSEDGEAWTILEGHETGLAGIGITDVTVRDGVYFLLEESYPFGDDESWGIRSVYRSDNGLQFEKTAGLAFAENELPAHLVAYRGRLFAAGAEFDFERGDPVAAVWHSPDGIGWDQMVLPPSLEPGLSFAGKPIVIDDGLVVTAAKRFYDGSAEGSSELSVFATENGIGIEQITAPPGTLDNVTEESTGAFFDGRLIILARGHCTFDCDPEPPLYQLTWTP